MNHKKNLFKIQIDLRMKSRLLKKYWRIKPMKNQEQNRLKRLIKKLREMNKK